MALLDDADFLRLRSLACSGVLDLQAVRAFLLAVFSPVAEGERRRGAKAAGGKGRVQKLARATKEAGDASSDVCDAQNEAAQKTDEASAEGEDGVAVLRRRFGVLALKKLAAELDMREESMESVLSYLEAEVHPCLRMLPSAPLSVKVSFYAASSEQLAPQHPVVQV